MKKESQILLIRKYPTLYTDNCQDAKKTVKQRGFNCGDGWFTLIQTLSELLIERSPTCIATLAEETYGTLDFEITNYKAEDYDFLHGLTTFARCLSRNICYTCGKQGWMFNSGGMMAFCQEHCFDTYSAFEPEAVIAIPITINGMGLMFHQMIINLYQLAIYHQVNKMPTVHFNQPFKKNGELQILYQGGNQIMSGMVELLLAYSKKVDEKTGEIINRSRQSDFH